MTIGDIEVRKNTNRQMKPSEILALQAMKYYDKQYMLKLEQLMKSVGRPGVSGVHIKKQLEIRLALIYKLIS